jgi:hypothetical protein
MLIKLLIRETHGGDRRGIYPQTVPSSTRAAQSLKVNLLSLLPRSTTSTQYETKEYKTTGVH